MNLLEAIRAASEFQPKPLTVPERLLREEFPAWVRETLYCRTMCTEVALALGYDGQNSKKDDYQYALRIFVTVFCDDKNVPVWDVHRKEDVIEAGKLVPFAIVKWFNDEAMIHNGVAQRPPEAGNGVDEGALTEALKDNVDPKAATLHVH